jgi:phage baseplate assembly protein W
LVDLVKPVIMPTVTGSSVFSSGIGFNQFGPKRQNFALMSGYNSIRDNLRNILFFRKGDYPDNSDFGVGLQDFLFEQNDELLRLALNQEIRRQISKYEPRIVIRSVSITTPAWADDSIVVNLDLMVNNVVLSGVAGANGAFNLSQSSAA